MPAKAGLRFCVWRSNLPAVARVVELADTPDLGIISCRFHADSIGCTNHNRAIGITEQNRIFAIRNGLNFNFRKVSQTVSQQKHHQPENLIQ
jgi:hypothetical protein